MLTIGLVATIVLVSGSLLFGHDGVPSLLALRAERQRLGEQAVALIQQNADLRDKVHRLRRDDRYLEKVARQELGLVGSDEVVYRFRRPGKLATP